MKAWLKGGLIGGVIGVIIATIWLFDSSIQFWPDLGVLFYFIFIPFEIGFFITDLLFGEINSDFLIWLTISVSSFIFYFIIGALIGWIVGKIKNKKTPIIVPR